VLEGTAGAPVERGGYALRPVEDPDVVLVGTGSEVWVCVEAAELLAEEGIHAQVVSLPSWDLFDVQPASHQDAVLPPDVPILSVEAGTTFGWERWADDSLGIDHFGASAPGERVLAELGFTAEHVAERARLLIDDLEEDPS
jgi:transketolase